jgi:hypothetical protein
MNKILFQIHFAFFLLEPAWGWKEFKIGER